MVAERFISDLNKSLDLVKRSKSENADISNDKAS